MSDDDTLDIDKVIKNLPWPRKGDRLFVVDDDRLLTACLNWSSEQWDLYVYGYKCAADALIEHIKDKDTIFRQQDILVFPIVFLYRHHIELQMKKIIMDGNMLFDIPEKFPKHHDIEKLWKQCRRILEKGWPEGPTEDLDAVEECIVQFSQTDPVSMAFRYPEDKKGNPSLSGLTRVNLGNLSEVVARLSSLLNGASIGISEQLGTKRDIESEYCDSSY